MNHLKVIIVGAGMGGLTTAIAMSQAGYDVEVYDRVREFRPAGAGISLWSNGVKILNRLGLGSEIAAIGGSMQRMSYIRKTGQLLTDFSLQPLVERVGQCPYPVARTDLQRLLLEAFGVDKVHLNAHCVAIEHTQESATAVFADGHRATGDLVVGADGTHSIIRHTVVGDSIERRYVGYVNWNGLVDVDERLAPKNSWVIYVGDAQRASMMPVGGDRFYFFFDVPLPLDVALQHNENVDLREELSQYFAGWAESVQHLIRSINPQTTNRIPIHDIDPLSTLVQGRIALLGDAAHSSSPDLGQGGCQSLEDAWVLTNSLLTTTLSVEDALQRYNVARRDRTANVILKARKRAEMMHGNVPERTQQWYYNLAQEDGTAILSSIADLIIQGPMG